VDGLRRPLLLTWSMNRGVGGLCQFAPTSDILKPNLGCGPAGYGRVRYAACSCRIRGRLPKRTKVDFRREPPASPHSPFEQSFEKCQPVQAAATRKPSSDLKLWPDGGRIVRSHEA